MTNELDERSGDSKGMVEKGWGSQKNRQRYPKLFGNLKSQTWWTG